MIPRNLEPVLRELARLYPVVTVTGPRQSGKTTLCRAVFPDKAYVSLEPLDNREFSRSDPRGFLAHHADGAVIDEVQNVPELLAYLQEDIDARPDPGRFILTGSQHFGLSGAIAQSLAGRTAVLTLLPLSLDELRRFPGTDGDLFDRIWQGAYPRIFDRGVPADRWFSDYVTTYVQRDVRQVLAVADLMAFTTFLKLCAGRTAQELNLAALGGDAGVSHNTARSWLGVLEASYLCHRLPAWHRNHRKQLIKAPKMHFLDTGLACHLLGIRSPDQLRTHPLRGALFESWVASEVLKARVHRGLAPDLWHYRETRGVEVDLLVECPSALVAVEAKSGATVVPEFLDPLARFAANASDPDAGRRVLPRLVYGGAETQRRSGVDVIAWTDLATVDWTDAT